MPTLKRRAYIINTHGIDKPAISKLLSISKKKIKFKGETKELEEALVEYDIDSPGLILQAAEKFFNGMKATDCIFGSGTEGSTDTKKLCNLVSKGDWKNALSIIKVLKKEEIVMVIIFLMGYLKTILLNPDTSSDKALKTAKAMSHISSGYKFDDDLPGFLAMLYIACESLSTK